MTVVPPRQVVEVPSTAAARVEIAGIRYYLLRIAAHTPSEHRLGKSAAAAEIQLYHRSADEKYFAISLLLEEAKPGETPTHLLDPYFAALSGSSKSGASKPGELDVAALVPPGGPFLEYTGSLTIPPCTADVLWWVLKTPLRVTPAQLSTLRESLTKPNQRPLQPLGDRTVRTLAKP
jgi:carbonic anhydrase